MDEQEVPTRDAEARSPDQLFVINMRERRDQLGLSQAELAKLCTDRGFQCHQQTVAKIESSKRNVSVGEAAIIAGVLETRLDLLLMRPMEVSFISVIEAANRQVERHWQGALGAMGELQDSLILLRGQAQRLIRQRGEYPPDAVKVLIARTADNLQRTPNSVAEKIAEATRTRLGNDVLAEDRTTKEVLALKPGPEREAAEKSGVLRLAQAASELRFGRLGKGEGQGEAEEAT